MAFAKSTHSTVSSREPGYIFSKFHHSWCESIASNVSSMVPQCAGGVMHLLTIARAFSSVQKTKRPKRRSTCSNVTDGTAVALKKAQDNSSGGTHSIASSRKPSAAGGWKPKQNPGCVKCGKTVYELEKVCT